MITHDTDGPFDNSIINHEPLLSFAFFNSTIDTWKEIWSNWFIIIHAQNMILIDPTELLYLFLCSSIQPFIDYIILPCNWAYIRHNHFHALKP